MKTINNLYIVDDDDIFRFLTNKIIKESQLVDKVWMYSNGQEAIESLVKAIQSKQSLPDIILLDLTMPVMDGWEFLDEFNVIRSYLEAPITIYIVSSSISPKDVEKVNEYNSVKDYVIKPITKAKFMDLLSSLV
ncbi:MAG: response regulator [Bacteroidetes bacterium]|nr:response regulator [Bacteroidota bacterium]